MILRKLFGLLTRDKTIERDARESGDIVYGSQSIKAQIGSVAREPGDWDLLSKNPLLSAQRVEKKLDREAGGDYYFVKSSKKHKGTHKIQEVGPDGLAHTDDDIEVADYSLPGRKMLSREVWNGLKVVDLSESEFDKARSLKDKSLSFRHAKDREDLSRIRGFKIFLGRR